MNNNYVIIGRTREGEIEVTTVRYVKKRGKNGTCHLLPNDKAVKLLEKYEAWQNLTTALEASPYMQEQMKKMWEPLL